MPRSSARNITPPRPKISSDSDTELIQGIIEQQTGFRSTNFARNLKCNNNGDKCAYINELRAEKKRKEYFNETHYLLVDYC